MELYRDDLSMKSSDQPEKFIYHFSAEKTEGSKDLAHLLGGKGAHLAEMTSMGLPVPPGFTITSGMNLYFDKNGRQLPDFFKKQVQKEIQFLERQTGCSFGSQDKPLLLSVRSGAQVSMPGMMDTILNIGLNAEISEKMAQTEARMAWDCYRRLIQMYGDVVLKIDASMFVFLMEDYKVKKKYVHDSELKAEDLKNLTQLFKDHILQMTGKEFPEKPEDQLFGAISAVFESWNNPRAVAYRELHSYSHHLGTAVNVQTMVFGNRGKNSATGVVFTRNPSTGEPGLFGEFLPQAQGEDVVAGIQTPFPIQKTSNSLAVLMPKVFTELSKISSQLEKYFKDMQDIEFTVEEGHLWILQTRKAKRSIQAALRVAVDFVEEGLMSESEALMSIHPKEFEQLLHPSLDPKAKKQLLSKGLPASPGGACGQITFSPAKVVQSSHKKMILVRNETSPEDIKGMISAQGILTARGGMTSHAAVVARGIGKCCVVGCHALSIKEDKRECWFGNHKLKEGDCITLDGSTGEIFLGEINMVQPQLNKYFHKFMQMSDRQTKIQVKANADTPEDAQTALTFGAAGIGLCRTEHMFFQEDRLDLMRKMILFQSDSEKRNEILEELLKKQQQDFYKIFKVMEGKPVCIRLLDPPLHEFLPQLDQDIKRLAEKWSEPYSSLRDRVYSLKEVNPMLGHRGCRLGVTFPELYQTQARAVAMAFIRLLKENKKCFPEIMIPLSGLVKEFIYVRKQIVQVLEELKKESRQKFFIPIGTMIEIPQAALRADELAQSADFFSFGSNDLTQTTLGISRDDCSRFLPAYIEKNIISADPFVQIEEKSVGWLILRAVELSRNVKKDFPLGLCGEHGADPSSISFLKQAGLNSISCSPYRIPSARLALAQSYIQKQRLYENN